MSRDWDAATYDRVSAPQVEWALRVLERLPLRGDETVLDAGCGSGRVTQLLLERLPQGHVVAVDSAPSMVKHAREALDPERVTVLEANLTDFQLDEPVDAAFSNAVFHWVPDHDALFARLHAALRPGALLVAQCGGEGNVGRFHDAAKAVGAEQPYADYLAGWQGPWNFAGAEETAERLERAGFTEIETWLEPYPVTPPDPTGFLRTVCLGHHLEQLPEELRAPYVEAVRERCGTELDYVRLNIQAKTAARRRTGSVPSRMAAEISIDRRDGGVAVLSLNAPDRCNALTVAMAEELVAACEQLDADGTVGAVVVRGEGGFFCAGGDRGTLEEAGRDPADPEVYAGLGAVYRSFARVGELSAPTIAAVRGGAVGAGLNLMLATDVRVVALDAKIISGFMPIGLHPGGGHGALLGRTGAREAAAAMALFGERIDGDRAAALGLAWMAVDDADVEQTAIDLAARAGADPELARRTAASLRTVLGPPPLPWPAALELERASQMWSMRRKALG